MREPERGRRLPAGLEVCGVCGAVRGQVLREEEGGTLYLRESTCFCDGLVCRSCGERRVRRPISDYYDPRDGGWWHVAYFQAFHPYCRSCHDAGRCCCSPRLRREKGA